MYVFGLDRHLFASLLQSLFKNEFRQRHVRVSECKKEREKKIRIYLSRKGAFNSFTTLNKSALLSDRCTVAAWRFFSLATVLSRDRKSKRPPVRGLKAETEMAIEPPIY